MKLIQVLKSRLESFEFIAKRGVIYGEIDSYELEGLIGRIKEIRYFLYLLGANSIAGNCQDNH